MKNLSSTTRGELSISLSSSFDKMDINMIKIECDPSVPKKMDKPIMELEMEEDSSTYTDDDKSVMSEPEDCVRHQRDESDAGESESDLESGTEQEEKSSWDPLEPNSSFDDDSSIKRHFFVAKIEDAAARSAGPLPPTSSNIGEVRRFEHKDSIVVGFDRPTPLPSDMRKLSKRRSILKTSSSCSETSCSSQKKNRIDFKDVVIREYSITLGDHPNCSIGPPISLDWEFEEFHPLALDEYESVRGRRRNLRQMLLNYYHRKHLFEHVLGFSKEEIKKAQKDVHKVKRQREITRTFLPVRKVEEVAESASRKWKRNVLKKKVVEKSNSEASVAA
mmetsp:Transcript_37348/g.54606  ORF Transcript_37348/g.54606 Transcript_37348/m.54606 type:complete len:333 (+) Transcript_37348:322-1320(+)